MLEVLKRFVSGMLFGFIIIFGLVCLIGPFIAGLVFDNPMYLLLYCITFPILIGIWFAFEGEDDY